MRYGVGYASGCFDLFHIGHLNVLQLAKAQCDLLIAGVATDQWSVRVKGKVPVVPLAERLDIVSSICHVDLAVEENADKLEMWRVLRFDVIFKGDDWFNTEKGARLEQDMSSVGVDVVYFPYTAHTSSTLLRQALARLSAAS